MTIRKKIEDRIKERDQAGFKNFREVEGAANLASILKARHSGNGCYVFRLRNSASKNSLDNGVSQQVKESYAVVIVTENKRDPRGGDSSDANEILCDQVNTALLGWGPDPSADPLEYGGGQLVTMKDGYFFWQEVYTTARLRRAV